MNPWRFRVPIRDLISAVPHDIEFKGELMAEVGVYVVQGNKLV
jgi:hypothetical protein